MKERVESVLVRCTYDPELLPLTRFISFLYTFEVNNSSHVVSCILCCWHGPRDGAGPRGNREEGHLGLVFPAIRNILEDSHALCIQTVLQSEFEECGFATATPIGIQELKRRLGKVLCKSASSLRFVQQHLAPALRADLLRAEKSDAGESINVAHIPKLLHHLLVTGLPDIFPNIDAEVVSFVQGGTGDDLRCNRHEFASCLIACTAHSCIQAAVMFCHVCGLCLEGAPMQ